MKILSNREYEALLAEVEYFRNMFEREQQRADRAVDALAEMSGRPPISAVAREEYVERAKKAEKLGDSLKELFAEESEVEEIADAKQDLEIRAKDFAKKHGATLPS